jgi:hypothetical protein
MRTNTAMLRHRIVALGCTEGALTRTGDGIQFYCVATLFSCGAGDGNRTRTIGLGIPYGPAIRAHVADLT